MKTLKDADLKDKKILMRVGFDVAINESGNIIDDSRIKEALPSIKYILKQKPRSLTLISHLGRPKGKEVESLKFNRVAERLAKILRDNRDIIELFKLNPDIKDIFAVKKEILSDESEIGIRGYKISKRISLLENIRFYPEEENNDSEFAEKLSSLGEIFIYEAFSASHREHASTTGIMNYLPSYAGIEMEKEVNELSKLLGEVERPYVLIIGGAKTEDKAPVIESLLEKADKILIGGKTSNLLREEGKYLNNDKILLTIDGFDKDRKMVKAEDSPLSILDIGPETIKLFRAEIVKAKTILAAGPLGMIEEASYANGTKEIYFAISYSNAYKVACGGDTMEALNKFGLHNNFNFISTGGGAALEFLAKGSLPVIDKLNSSK